MGKNVSHFRQMLLRSYQPAPFHIFFPFDLLFLKPLLTATKSGECVIPVLKIITSLSRQEKEKKMGEERNLRRSEEEGKKGARERER